MQLIFIARLFTLVLEIHSSLQYCTTPDWFRVRKTLTSWNDCLRQLYDLVQKVNNREPKNMDAKLLTSLPNNSNIPSDLSFQKVIMWPSDTSSRMQRLLVTHSWTDALDILHVREWRGCRGFSSLSDCDTKLLKHAHTLLLILLPRQPEVLLVLHDVSQHSSTQEHHVFAPWRIFNPDLEFLQGVT